MRWGVGSSRTHARDHQGQILQQAGQFKEALDCHQRSLTMFRELDDPVNVAIVLGNIGIIFERQGHYQEALIKYQEALQLKRQYSSPQSIAITERDIAHVKKQI